MLFQVIRKSAPLEFPFKRYAAHWRCNLHERRYEADFVSTRGILDLAEQEGCALRIIPSEEDLPTIVIEDCDD